MRCELLARTEGQSSPPSCIYLLHIVVHNHWTGLVDCTGARDWWTALSLVQGTGGLHSVWCKGLVDCTQSGARDWWTALSLVQGTGGLHWCKGLVDWIDVL